MFKIDGYYQIVKQFQVMYTIIDLFRLQQELFFSVQNNVTHLCFESTESKHLVTRLIYVTPNFFLNFVSCRHWS